MAKAPTIKFTYEDDDGVEHEFQLPARNEVCPGCDGSGSHMTPSLRDHAITAEEWDRDWDDESREMYMNGGYDVTCQTCDGRRVVPVVDEEKCDKDLLQRYRDHLDDEAAYRSMCEAERRFGC